MFGKYFAYEFRNSCMMPLLSCALALFVGCITGIGCAFRSRPIIIFAGSILGICTLACFIIAYNGVKKTFTDRLFSKTGYLTLTMPVSTHTVLLSKLLVNLLFILLYIISYGLAVTFVLCCLNIDGVNLSTILLFAISSSDYNALNTFLILMKDLLAVLCFLCLILFILTFSNCGIIKKNNRVLLVLAILVGLIAYSRLTSINIIPFHLYYDSTLHKYLFMETISTDTYFAYMNAHPDSVVKALFSPSELLWNVLGIFGFYFGSYYLITHKLDIE